MLAVLCGVSVANIYYAQPLLRQIGSDLSIPPAGLGFVVALAQLGYVVGLIVLVPLSDLVNRKKLTAIQIVAAATGTMLVALATTNLQLLIGMAVAGTFSVVVQVIVAYAAAISDPDERGANIGVITSGVVVGIILARTVAGAVADLAGWRAVYAGSTFISVLVAAVALTMLPKILVCNTIGVRTCVQWGPVVTLTLTNRLFRTRALIALFLFASFGALWSGMALPLVRNHGGRPTQIRALRNRRIGWSIGRGRCRSVGRSRQSATRHRGVVGRSLAVVGIQRAGDALAGVLVVGVVALDFAVQAVHVTSQNLIVANTPESSGQIIGSYMVFYSLGSAAGAVSTTMVFDAAGWGAASILGGAYAFAALIAWTIDRLRTRNTLGS